MRTRLQFLLNFGVLLVFVASKTVLAKSPSCFEGARRFARGDWKFCHPINDDIFLYYSPIEEAGNVLLGFHATKDTFGWTALALAGNGGMKGASQIVVRLNDTNEWIAEDRHSENYTTPTLDDSQDVKLLFAEQTDQGETSWAVLLPLNSCDIMDYSISNVSVFMHWAIGADHSFGFHGTRRGQFHVNLMQATPEPPPPSQTMPFLDLKMPDLSLDEARRNGEQKSEDPTNSYHCAMFDLNQLLPEDTDSTIVSRRGDKRKLTLNKELHLTRLSPVLNEASKPFVHHMILYGCVNNGRKPNSDFEHMKTIECQRMPPGCPMMKWAWALGSEDVVLPDDVGLPLGGENQNWVVLQTHYYNPNLVPNVHDSSGVRVYYSADHRPQEAGMMSLQAGGYVHTSIPAGESDYALDPAFVIPSSCTAQNWASPLNILGVAHHMHLSGRVMEIGVERDGVNLGLLRDEKHYDFNHQSMEQSLLPQLLPGDQIDMNCRYDTSTRTEDVKFGDLTQDEMCYAVVMYYPKQKSEGFAFVSNHWNATMCTAPATDPTLANANLSACTQNYLESVPHFFQFSHLSPFPFGALEMCNSVFYEALVMQYAPNSCPDCYKTRTCTNEDVIAWGQNVVCPRECGKSGVSVYPNVSLTERLDLGVWGCSQDGGASTIFGTLNVQYYDFDRLDLQPQEAPACVAVGNLSLVMELSNQTFGSSSARSISWFVSAVFVIATASWALW